jgi:hypothetical protein
MTQTLPEEDSMTTTVIEEDDEVILVDLQPAAGVRSVSADPKDIAAKSKEAIDHAMKSMRGMAKKTVKAIKEIPVTERPHKVEVSFGLKLTAEGNAMVAKAGMEAAINVTMTWERKEKE